jgi:hypothetical protein
MQGTTTEALLVFQAECCGSATSLFRQDQDTLSICCSSSTPVPVAGPHLH